MRDSGTGTWDTAGSRQSQPPAADGRPAAADPPGVHGALALYPELLNKALQSLSLHFPHSSPHGRSLRAVANALSTRCV